MSTEQPPSFATLLRQYRRAAGLTQEELAERAGLSRAAINTLERGTRRTPRKETLALLAEALALTASERALLEASARRRELPLPSTPSGAPPGVPITPPQTAMATPPILATPRNAPAAPPGAGGTLVP
jgi:transcriptional regulator with XRE-family HTH domain